MATRLMIVRLTDEAATKIFHERNDEHPHKPDGKHGEALVVAGRTVQVARTPAVMSAIQQNILEECAGETPDAPLPNLSRLQSAEAARQAREAADTAALHAQSVADAQTKIEADAATSATEAAPATETSDAAPAKPAAKAASK